MDRLLRFITSAQQTSTTNQSCSIREALLSGCYLLAGADGAGADGVDEPLVPEDEPVPLVGPDDRVIAGPFTPLPLGPELVYQIAAPSTISKPATTRIALRSMTFS